MGNTMTSPHTPALSASANDALLSLVGHEMRNPLAVISLALHTMARSDTAQGDKARALIAVQLRLLASLADELQDSARIARDGVRVRLQRTSLREVLVAAVESTSHAYAVRRHCLLTALPPVDVYCAADPVRLAQVFTNLLSNAARYTPDGGRIQLFADLKGGHCSIRVKDNGCGIAGDDLPHLFELYFRSAQARALDASGLGIGLALVKTVVQLHGGTVAARSPGPGLGSEFLVLLPVETQATAAAGSLVARA
jgi:signal transduction histidine kinase